MVPLCLVSLLNGDDSAVWCLERHEAQRIQRNFSSNFRHLLEFRSYMLRVSTERLRVEWTAASSSALFRLKNRGAGLGLMD